MAGEKLKFELLVTLREEDENFSTHINGSNTEYEVLRYLDSDQLESVKKIIQKRLFQLSNDIMFLEHYELKRNKEKKNG